MIAKDQVQKSVQALMTILKSQKQSVNIVDQPEKIDLQITLKQIPKSKHKILPILLPNSIHYNSREVCIFVKDLNQKDREYQATVTHYEELFKKANVTTISKIVPIKALRTDYSMPSNKRSLAKAYDLYLADECVIGLLPGLLGKIFYAKNKLIPIQVDLKAPYLKREINSVVLNTRCILQGTGSSSMVTVANDSMSENAIVKNILAAIDQLSGKLPGGTDNIRNIYLKSTNTTAIPLYIDLGSPNEIVLPEVKVTAIPTYVDDITTVLGGKIMVRADGMVQYIKDQPESQEVKVDTEDTVEDKKPILSELADLISLEQSHPTVASDKLEKDMKTEANKKLSKTAKKRSGETKEVAKGTKGKRQKQDLVERKEKNASAKKGRKV